MNALVTHKGVMVAIAIVSSVGLDGCGGLSNDLWGSITQTHPMDFDHVDILGQDNVVVIDYVRNGNTNEHPCKVSIFVKDLPLGDDTIIAGQAFLDSVNLERITVDDPGFPAHFGGSVDFVRYHFALSGKMEGEFTFLFDDGTTLFGSFNGTMENSTASR